MKIKITALLLCFSMLLSMVVGCTELPSDKNSPDDDSSSEDNGDNGGNDNGGNNENEGKPSSHKHDLEITKGKAATCTEMGVTDGKVCRDCGAVVSIMADIPIAPHDFNGGNKCIDCGLTVEYTESSLLYELINGGTEYTVTGLNKNGFVTNIVIPREYNGKPVTEIAADAFADSIFIDSIIVLDNIKNIGEGAFQSSIIDLICISADIDRIENKVFYDCQHIPDIRIPNTVTYVGDYAFYRCTGLTAVNIPNGVTYIGEAAFSDCYLLEKTALPDTLEYAGEFAFFSCMVLEEVSVGEGLTYLSRGIFGGCEGLKNIYIGCNVTRIEERAVECSGLLERVDIPEGVTFIGNSAFSSCVALKEVKLPSTLKTIGDLAFAYCYELEIINMPEEIESIGIACFEGAQKVGEKENGVGYIGNWAISCLEGKSELIIREGTVGIMGYAFAYKSLEYMYIPKSVKQIGEKAFYQCIGPDIIEFEGSESEWNSISKDKCGLDTEWCEIYFDVEIIN